jgi:FkbH-like protein
VSSRLLNEQLTEVKRLATAGDWSAAYRRLSTLLVPDDEFLRQTRVARHMTMPASALGLKPLRIAMLATNTVDHFVPVFKYWLALQGFSAEIWIAPFNTIESTVFEPSGALYCFKPDLVWLFTTARDVQIEATEEMACEPAVAAAVGRTASLWNVVHSHLDCTILQNNADIPTIDDFGNFAGQSRLSRRNLLRRYNLELAAAAPNGVVLIDIEHLSAVYGKRRWADARYWYHSKHAFAMDAYGPLAFQTARVIAALKGQAKKCVVLDLDGTLWGGTIGDDGLRGIRLGDGADGEAFVDFQRWLRGIKERGILLAVCSKNEEAAAKEPFTHHPDCQLRLEDFAAFRANWNPKIDNIRQIAHMLNIGLDSFVFIDDNPVERDLVRTHLPMVEVPELPQDVSDYIEAIERHCFFETVNLSAEDRDRTRLYRENSARAELMNNYTNIDDYLASLDMVAIAADLDEFHLPRMAQLINKSNQFHLTGTRYTDAELQRLSRMPNYAIRYFKLSDRFGDNGLISVIVGKQGAGADFIIDTWVMSCRVLGRTMEEFVCQDVAVVAREFRCNAVVGRYVPSAKNKLVASLYERLGFEKISESNGTTEWRLAIEAIPMHLLTHVRALQPNVMAAQ